MKRTPLNRRTPLKAKSELKRSGRIKARRKDKREREAYIRKHYGSRDRLLKIKATPCCVCGDLPSENHHLVTAGRPWESVVALCFKHHQEYHRIGRHTFAQRHAIDLAAIAETLAQEVKP